ncbi:MAG TPA: sigma-70 family RNA polymerase sigma factor [Streptosporangiaceae bacterium]|nr:sigma-70 family RNA polymerase sigma factor [Streptosporangiaceae bacterium]
MPSPGLGCWQRLRKYDVPEAWVRKVAFRIAVDTSRRTSRRRLLPARLARSGSGQASDAARSAAAAQLESPRLVAALTALPMAQREVIVLHYLADLPVEQIARDLAVPLSTVKSRLVAARRRLAAEKSTLGWKLAGPELPLNAKPEAAPYVVSLGKGRLRGWSLTVLNWRTGAVLGHVPRPDGRCFGEVSGAADDRTFLVTTNSCGVPINMYVYELRLSASGRPEPLIPISLPNFRRGDTTLALSPGGRYLAYASFSQGKTHRIENKSSLIVYNLMNGTKRSWTGPGLAWSVAWTGNKTLVFDLSWNDHSTKPPIAMGVRLLSIEARVKSYVGSHALRAYDGGYPLPAAGSVLYGTALTGLSGVDSEIVRYSIHSGKREITFRPWQLIGSNYNWCDPMWTDGSGRHALAACGSPVHYLRIDGNRMRQVNLPIPIQDIDPAMNAYYFAF